LRIELPSWTRLVPFQKDDETNGEAITAAGPEDVRNVRQNCGGTNRAQKQEEINAVALVAMMRHP
jgi:hypothetical protein